MSDHEGPTRDDRIVLVGGLPARHYSLLLMDSLVCPVSVIAILLMVLVITNKAITSCLFS
jgi:hypothetical protein